MRSPTLNDRSPSACAAKSYSATTYCFGGSAFGFDFMGGGGGGRFPAAALAAALAASEELPGEYGGGAAGGGLLPKDGGGGGAFLKLVPGDDGGMVREPTELVLAFVVDRPRLEGAKVAPEALRCA